MSGSALVVTGLLVTVVPTAIYLAALWLLDPYEREPLSDLGLMLLAGATIAPLLTAGLEIVLGIPSSLQPAGATVLLQASNLWGPVLEEVGKGAVIVAAFAMFRREFDDTLDGLVYGAVVGAGFALATSLLYLRTLASLGAMAQVGPGSLFSTFVAGLNQCFFSALLGAGLGAMREDAPGKWILPLLGFAVAAIYHVGYAGLTYLATTPAGTGTWAAWAGIARLVADWAGVLIIIVMVRWAWERERRIFERTLRDEVAAGTVTADEFAILTAGEHGRHQLHAWRRGGWGHYLAVRRLHQAQAHLAFAKWRQARGLSSTDEVSGSRETVGRLRRIAEATAS